MINNNAETNISEFVERLKSHESYKGQIEYIETFKSKQPLYDNIDIDPAIKEALHKIKIQNLYFHQVSSINLIRHGKDMILSTGTSSGKTESFIIPIFEAILNNPKTRALYIAPTKALINDQSTRFNRLKDNIEFPLFSGKNIVIRTFTGDTPKGQERRDIKNNANIVLTTPEMINLTILAYNNTWSSFLSNLKYIILDESHYYRGIGGSNMSLILRRLLRICEKYNSSPQLICCSATIGNPKEHAEALIGKEFFLIDNDCSGNGSKEFVLWNPPIISTSQNGYPIIKSPVDESIYLFTQLIKSGIRTILFMRKRQTVERATKSAKYMLERDGLTDKISSYRSGYFNEERRMIEERLSNGNLLGVITTNALELGIDIGNLDACIISTYPGSVMSTRQMSGRAGRKGKDSITILVAGQDALDQYYMRHPEEFFNKPCEKVVLNISNPYILKNHAKCIAYERNIRNPEDKKYFENNLEDIIIESNKESYEDMYTTYRRITIRGTDEDKYTIFNENTDKIIEKEINKSQAFKEAHEGAIFIHKGETYHINKIDHDKKSIYATETTDEYITDALCNINIEIENHIYQPIDLSSCKDVKVGFGKAKVTEHVKGYIKYGEYKIIETTNGKTEKILDITPLELPPTVLHTEAVWFELPDRIKEFIHEEELDFDGGIHAIEHAMISMYPLHVLADRNDIGGVSTSKSNSLQGKGGIFIYDACEGGAGYAREAYTISSEILESTLKCIEECPCDNGCPSCVLSPKCGNLNEPMDKQAAIKILRIILSNNE